MALITFFSRRAAGPQLSYLRLSVYLFVTENEKVLQLA